MMLTAMLTRQPLPLMLLGALLFSALVAVESIQLESLANYSKPIASICIAIPPAGESYQIDSDTIKKSTTKLNVVQSSNPREPDKANPEKSPEASSVTRKTPPTILINDTWVLPVSSDPALARASLQYYVKIKGTTSPQFWAGETIIPNSRLSAGNHILTYEQVVGEDAKLILRVWWNSEEMMFQKSSEREVYSNLYESSHVVFFGPPTLQKSARALCYDDQSPAASKPAPHQTTLAIVATSVLLALLLVGLLALVLVRRHCRADSLDIADHSVPEEKAANTVAGLGSSYDNSENIAYQPVDSEE